MPTDLPSDVLIGSSNSLSWFEVQNQKDVSSRNNKDAKSAMELRRKYQYYNMQKYKFLSVNCYQNHFVVMSVTFDVQLDWGFDDVVVYDSL